MASAYRDNSIKIFSISTKGYVIENLLEFEEISNLQILYIKFSQNINYFIVSDSLRLQIFDMTKNKWIHQLEDVFTGSIHCMDITSNDKYLICGTENALEIFDMQSGYKVRCFKMKFPAIILNITSKESKENMCWITLCNNKIKAFN